MVDDILRVDWQQVRFRRALSGLVAMLVALLFAGVPVRLMGLGVGRNVHRRVPSFRPVASYGEVVSSDREIRAQQTADLARLRAEGRITEKEYEERKRGLA